MTNNHLQGIYGITDDKLLSPDTFYTKIEEALKGGLCALQYRSKDSSYLSKKETAGKLLPLCRSYNTPLIINDDVALCLDISADGVHLGRSDTALAEAREALGSDAIIGITCHNDFELATQAQAGSASYAAFGRFFNSSTKPSAPPASIDVLRRASKELQIPTVAIGGINAENGGQLVAAGASMLAVVNSLFAGNDVTANLEALNNLYN